MLLWTVKSELQYFMMLSFDKEHSERSSDRLIQRPGFSSARADFAAMKIGLPESSRHQGDCLVEDELLYQLDS